MTWDYLRRLGELTAEQRGDPLTIALVRDTMGTVRECIAAIHDQLVNRGYLFRNPEAAFCPASSDTESMVKEIEDRFGEIPLSLRYFWIDVGSVDFCQDDNQMVMWHRPERKSATDLQILGEEDPLYVTSASAVLGELIAAEPKSKKQGHGARFGWREPHMDRWYCHLACDEFHKANYSGGANYNFFLPDRAADFRIYDLFTGQSMEEDSDREWFVDHLVRSIDGGGFRGRIVGENEVFSKPPPKNKTAIDIAAAVQAQAERGRSSERARRILVPIRASLAAHHGTA